MSHDLCVLPLYQFTYRTHFLRSDLNAGRKKCMICRVAIEQYLTTTFTVIVFIQLEIPGNWQNENNIANCTRVARFLVVLNDCCVFSCGIRVAK